MEIVKTVSEKTKTEINSIRSILHLASTILLMGLFQFSYAQESREANTNHAFPFTEANWTVENKDGSEAEIKTAEYKGRQALELEASQIAYLKGRKYKNFEIEFYCNGLSAPGFGFRVQDKKNYEYLYLRLGLSGKRDALQYVPIFKGSLPWQLYNYPKYEGKATFPREIVAAYPVSFKDELTEGKTSDKVLAALAEKGLPFSKESEITVRGEVNYIFDPEEMNALLFGELNDKIVFSDPRTWIHVKVEVVEDRAAFYIEDMKTPALVIENLKREALAGGISLIGDGVGVYFADVSIKEIKDVQRASEDSSYEKLPAGYLTKWNISEMIAKDSINFAIQVDSLLQDESRFKPIEADGDGLVNISRFYDDMTKTVALTCNLVANAGRTVQLNFDYADHLVIFLNSDIVFDKGMNFRPPADKGEEGRVFVDDESVGLNLKKGSNQLVFLLSADNRQKFNWGYIAKLENLEGISLEK